MASKPQLIVVALQLVTHPPPQKIDQQMCNPNFLKIQGKQKLF